MKELKEIDSNKFSALIKFALEKRGGNLEGYFNRFLLSPAIKNMRKIAIGEETQVSDYRLFFEGFKGFLDKELLNKELLAQLYQEEKNVNQENEDITFDLKGLEEKITEKKENEVYLKILTLSANSGFEKLTVSKVSQIFNTLEFFLNKSDFFQSVDFSTKMDAIYYSLTHAESFETAKMLVRLSDFDLLTEGNLKKINANPQLNIKLFSNVLNKLNLSGGIDHLLTQANLDKLLENPELNLEVLAKFIQAEDKSNILTQEKFDLAINLKNLLTQENIDQLIGLNTVDFEKIVPVLVTMHKTNILNQDNFLKFLDTFLNASIYDAQQDRVDGVSLDESGSSISLVDRLCSTLVDFLSRVEKFFQEFFDDILKYFNEKTEIDNNTIINQTVNADSGVSSRASLFGNSSQRESINKNEELTSNIVNSR
ncbi:hypothetical protein [Rickettsiella endosymbiont of Miltochrista miniata]|uniref:hypothetical protein n=1 Tax=Rickettsiella endosymbiont of Miltochrista miniata TaxID=3066239 RepID=UPI00313D8986